ncbi:helix-turn-helix domain-containing protein [uncultured Kordia sp.]|uniref:helix-turn-helix domain-containing protein n=1 Tax=uncultured Kordia sp. TaxID=507699 RepID=UPI00260D13D3|nr:helix-turn-helix domain-containing protein [uncultured Kordia sp.]
MKKLYFPIILFLFTFCIYAQQPKSVSFESLETISNDSLKKLAISYRFKNSSKAKIYASELYNRAKLDKKLRYDASHINALIFNILEKKDSAHHFIDIAINEAQKSNNKRGYVNSLQLKGNIYYQADSYDEASEIYVEVYKLIKEEDDIDKIVEIRHNMSLVKTEIGQTKQAIALAKKNLALYTDGVLNKENQPTKYINTLINVNNIYIHLADNFRKYKTQYLDSAEIYNTEALKKSVALNDLEGHSMLLSMKGMILQRRGNLENALVTFKAAEKQIKKLGFNNQLYMLYQLEGKNFFLQKEYDEAIDYLLKVDSIIGQNNTNSPTTQETYTLLAQCYEKKNNKELALKYHKIYEEKDKQNDIFKRKVSENIYKKYDIPAFEETIKKLESTSEKAQLKSKALIYVCLILFFVISLGFWYYKNREQNQKNRFQHVIKELKEMELAQQKKIEPYVVTDENVRKIIEGLDKFEAKKLFLQKKCTLNYVAKKINTNSTYLSKTLQTHKQKKFVQYITDLRLNYALSQLKNDKKFRTYDIKSIASELGFNTSESFSKAFKKRTGIYPSFYIKNLNKLKGNEGNL